MRLLLAIWVGKITGYLCRILGTGGTTLPGLVSQTIDPSFVEKITKDLKKGSVVISGTNGKTTTANMLASILKEANISYVHNKAGANLMRGVASALIWQIDIFGKIDKDLGIFEIDEATIPYAIAEIKPKIVLITNFFRDQLDRYGELNTISNLAKKSLKDLSKSALVILNAHDPFVANLGGDLKNKTIYFGLEDKNYTLGKIPHSADVTRCRQCDKPYTYKTVYFSHIGKFSCPFCQIHSPAPQIKAENLKIKSPSASSQEITTPSGKFKINLNLGGIYNTYNALAATAISYLLGIKNSIIKKGLENFKPAFGRIEEIKVGPKKIFLFLVKNPTGMNEVLRTISSQKNLNLIFALNDNFADGRDVSWIWDADLEILKDKTINQITASGIRAEDMALRLKYAGLNQKIKIEKDYKKALLEGLGNLKILETLYILPTYTAMLDLRKTLQKMGLVKGFWLDTK